MLFKILNLEYKIENRSILEKKNFTVEKNKHVLLLGPSGCGKTTLINLMTGLLKPSSGEIFFENKNFSVISEEQKTVIRKKKIGLIFQQFYLIPNYTALENVMFPMQINNIKNEKKKASLILSDIGLDHRKNNLPSELSGGEQQRVAIARAISFDPDIILADEPTGNLDRTNTERVSNLLLDYSKTKK